MLEYKVNSCEYDIRDFIKKIAIEEYHLEYWKDWLDSQQYDELKNLPNLLISVEDDKRLVGICSIKEVTSDECCLNSFYIDKAYRNRGIGSIVFRTCEYYAKKFYKKIVLCTDPVFDGAIHFYEKRKFIFDYYDEERRELHYYKEF